MKQLTEAQLERVLRAAYSAGFRDRHLYEKDLQNSEPHALEGVATTYLQLKDSTVKHLAGQV